LVIGRSSIVLDGQADFDSVKRNSISEAGDAADAIRARDVLLAPVAALVMVSASRPTIDPPVSLIGHPVSSQVLLYS
jgi:hypothetical protein